ncbi:2,3,4,5-tetrahydropyridine-2,6-dicarboxylate N-succinyltransferase, partial [Streptomyces sp. URMC 125]
MTEAPATATPATGAVAAGLATVTADGGTVLDTWFPAPELAEDAGPSGTERLSAERAAELLGEAAPQALGPD